MFEATYIDEKGNTIYELTQWDSNQTLRLDISGFSITGTTEIHFCNQKSKLAKVVTAQVSGSYVTAKIPNTLLQEHYTILAYLYVKESNGSSKSTAFIELPVNKRKKPEGYVYTNDVDVVSLEELNKKVTLKLQELDTKLKEADTKFKEANAVLDRYMNNIATLSEIQQYIV